MRKIVRIPSMAILAILTNKIAIGNDDQYMNDGTHVDCYWWDCSPWHDCSEETFTMGDLEAAVQLIPEIPVETLMLMDETVPNLIFHADREAVQVTACTGAVLASVELTASQKADLASLDG